MPSFHIATVNVNSSADLAHTVLGVLQQWWLDLCFKFSTGLFILSVSLAQCMSEELYPSTWGLRKHEEYDCSYIHEREGSCFL